MLILGLILLSLCVTSFTVVFSLILQKSKQTIDFTPDYLLILGCRVKKDTASQTLKTRINSASEYLKENENVIAFCCGGLVHAAQTVSEASVIEQGLIENGIDKSRLILEDKSKTTQQNFLNVKRLLTQYDIKKDVKLAFLSSDFHIFRAELISNRAKLPCLGISAKSPRQRRIKNYIREVAVLPFVYLRK